MIKPRNALAFGAAAAFIFVGPATLPPEITGTDTVAAATYTASAGDQPGIGHGFGLGGTNAGGGGSKRNN
ncbi:hypothetical protein AB0B45_24195 [Nonomuraea sp. NPDC049152]|uniref:hypothetical protein n=1 Tax=Nonomuraea sp. NPDC049152 TaxID=3154350 RepID=UPI0033D15198